MILIILFIIILIFTVLENWFRELERFNPNAIKGGKAGMFWHIAQLVALIVTFGYVCLDKYGITSIKGYATLLLMGTIWFICFDGGLNLLRGLPFFRVSTQSSDPFRKYGTPAAKIILLLASLAIYVYTIIFQIN